MSYLSQVPPGLRSEHKRREFLQYLNSEPIDFSQRFRLYSAWLQLNELDSTPEEFDRLKENNLNE